MKYDRSKIVEGLRKYLSLLEWYHQTNVTKDKEFQKHFIELFDINHELEHINDVYFEYLEKSKQDNVTFDEVITMLYSRYHKCYAHLVAKLISMRNPYYPYCDDYVLKDLGVDTPDDNPSEWINTYNHLLDRLQEAMKTDSTLYIIKEFDKDFPELKDLLSPTKKLDVVLWEIKDLTVAELYAEILRVTGENN